MSKLQIGTSGWVYKHWMDIFYPPHLHSDQQLPFYAQHFSTVEINFSFYRLPERSVFETWRQQTPSNFIFAVKGSRYLTHMKKLKDPIEPLERLMQRASGLQEKLGPILFQFPHTWHINIGRLQPFLELLQTYPQQRFTFEFRHQSWLIPQVYKLLENAGAALCLPVSPTVPLDVSLTTSWTYIRMHSGQWGVGYNDEELSIWAERIRSFLTQNIDVYLYFNNDPDGHAIRDAQRLYILLGYC
ncbi:MAG: DUF72 domain-containing protein [Calothrix sp. FI2-JRJ7]|jgi:uncharacterized protein YecE (DUF72 family)|nr:DUF72 domain-containing protein [Calothrix sp. FI2-JRJ7]